ncbi:branched-chain amino acid transport system ATP-binding protein [Enhydrobacter aerosaccus]|uniref:Branched-chain amino acid transport system ATP-binding protein n=1 Tax=Enhydrobacter aerosaccus TaxID=225324 RepID=A0A1T4JRE2_9HYPH|nr:ABC transporter ATP-binding protein [Enhydrobacter aerosaccus]SJZ32637.1 branched-chain amino acid transport system ATP-binding protein [Enhydrobacter aerosaccus]
MTPALELTDLRKSFGAMEIIRGVTLSVPAGERHAVIGPNGAGKSTLFHLISGHYRPSAGTIRLGGETISGMAPHLINRRGLSRSFQITNIFPRLSVWENVRCATLWAMGYRYSFWRNIERLADARQRTEEILTEINLLDRWHVPAGVLSYAEQRALEIGLSIAGNAEVLLLDEPTAGMSRAETERVVALIRRVSEKRTLLMIEHDMGVVFDLADRISVLVYGEILASDTPERVKANPAVQQAYLGLEAS